MTPTHRNSVLSALVDYDYYTNYENTLPGSEATFLRGTSTLLLRGGLVLIQVGCIPSTKVQNIILQNIVDIAVSTIIYMCLGYTFAFGHDAAGVIGYKSSLASNEADANNAVLGWAALVIASGLHTTMIAGRMHCAGYVIISIIFAGFVHPIILHWIWANSGFTQKMFFAENRVFFLDYAGGCVIHVTGSVLAMLSLLFLGRRIIRLRDLDESSLPTDAPGTVILGYILVIVGLLGMCLPTPSSINRYDTKSDIGMIMLNNIISAATGITVVLLLKYVSKSPVDHWMTLRCLQGAVAGIVVVSAGVDLYNPLVAFGISLCGVVIFFVLSKLIQKSALEDFVNIVPIHFICGLFGLTLAPLCGSSQKLNKKVTSMIANFGWQIICTICVILFVAITMTLTLIFLTCCNILRNWSETLNHKRAMMARSRTCEKSMFKPIFFKSKTKESLQPGYRTKNESVFSITDSSSKYPPISVISNTNLRNISSYNMLKKDLTSKHIREKSKILPFFNEKQLAMLSGAPTDGYISIHSQDDNVKPIKREDIHQLHSLWLGDKRLDAGEYVVGKLCNRTDESNVNTNNIYKIINNVKFVTNQKCNIIDEENLSQDKIKLNSKSDSKFLIKDRHDILHSLTRLGKGYSGKVHRKNRLRKFSQKSSHNQSDIRTSSGSSKFCNQSSTFTSLSDSGPSNDCKIGVCSKESIKTPHEDLNKKCNNDLLKLKKKVSSFEIVTTKADMHCRSSSSTFKPNEEILSIEKRKSDHVNIQLQNSKLHCFISVIPQQI